MLRARSAELLAALSAAASCVFSTVSADAAPPPEPAAEPRPEAEVIPPKLASDPAVPYPEGARGDAVIVLTLVIATDGSVTSAAPEPAQEPFASEAVRRALDWRFEPALRDGVPVAAKIRFEVRFVAPAPEPAPEAPVAAVPGPSAPSGPAPAPRPPEKPVEVLVEGERPEPSRTVTLSRAEVREIPGTFGDPFRAVETMPGVTPIVSGLPFFFIRGAPPGNAGYFLDGLRVPLLFHVGIGPSVVHPALIERVDLYPGGYPARFGRVSGGVVAGETVPPSTELHGEYNLRLFDAGALVEAPFDERRGAILLGGRYSYTAALLSLVSPETILEYWDYQGRVHYALGASDRVEIFSFGSYDFVGEKAATETLTLFGTEFHRVDLRYDHDLAAGGALRSAFSLGIDRSRLMDGRFVNSRMAGARTELAVPLSEHALLRWGTDLEISNYEVEIGLADLAPSAERIAELFPSRNDVAAGVRGDVVIDLGPRLTLTPGLRADVYGSEGVAAFALDPRLALKTVISERVRLLTALGIAHQPPAFVVPVPGFQPGGLRGGLQRSIQESLGVEVDVAAGTTATATVFQNAFFDMSDPLGASTPLTRGCPPGAYPADVLGPDPGGQPDGAAPNCVERFDPGTVGPDRSGGPGQAADSRASRRAAEVFEVRSLGSSYGLELYLKRRLTSRVGGFFSYTLSRSTRSYADRRYTAAFDRTHVLNGALAFDLGKSWRAGTRATFYTGLPKVEDPNDPESTRLPPFFRLDLRVEKRFQLSRAAFLALVAEWMNATLAKEAVTTRCTLAGCEAETIGPITIPSLGLEGAF